MRVTLKMTVVTMALGIVVGCTPGVGGDGGVPECESDLDCEGLDQCHPTLNICVQDCTADDADTCPAVAPECNAPDDEGNYPLEEADPDADERFRAICVCIEDADCGAGETCDPVDRECVADGNGDECTVATEDEDCAADEICVDGECVVDGDETCEFDDDCFGSGGLCATDDMCYLAEDLTADCADADEAPAQAGPPHIVVYGDEDVAVTPSACGADGTDAIRSFIFDVYSEVTFNEDHVYRANFDLNNDRFIETTVAELPGFDDEYLVTVEVCGNPNEIALYIDTGASVSNAYCFDATP